MTDEREKIQSRTPIDNENSGLWEHMTRDVTPIDRRDILPPAQDKNDKKYEQKPNKPSVRVSPSAPELILGKVEKARDIDGSSAQKLRKGRIPIEARLDLHGMTQIQAYDALIAFLRKCVARDLRCVLVITGKGARRVDRLAYDDEPLGVLKQRVPQWLNDVSMHEYVLKTQEAQPKDGGGGALYVLLRRRR